MNPFILYGIGIITTVLVASAFAIVATHFANKYQRKNHEKM